MKTGLYFIVAVVILIGAFMLLPRSKSTNTTDTSKSTADAVQSANSTTPAATTKAVIKTSRGSIEISLNSSAAPKTVANFIAKAKAGFYNGLTFHRVEDWVVQGGDPKGDGTGGGNQPTELSSQPFVIGAVGIARGGDIQVSNDAQFFIVKKDSQFLNNQYTYFGLVTNGMDVVNATQIGDKIDSITIQ